MSRVRILMLAVASVLVVLVGCVWFLPGLLDWNRYRDGIETLASARVGRPVRIGGGITLHLLPQPILTATDVLVEDDGDGIGLKARALRLRVALGALLSGTVDARELTLQGAELRLPWPPPPGALAGRPPAWITGLRAEVEDSRLQVGAVVLDHINGTLATDPDTGTLSAAGVGQAGPRTWQFTARLARPGRDGAAGLDVSLDGQGKLQDTGGTFSGQIAADGALNGRVAARGPDLSQLMPGPALAWRGDGRLSAGGGLAVAEDLAMEIGGVPARGAVALRVAPQARLDLAITTGRLDLDAWLPALLVQSAGPPGLPTGIDLSAEAASWGGGTLRRVRAAMDLGEDGVLLREVSALLPGEAQLDLSGKLGGAAPGFTGSARLSAPDLGGTLQWVRGALPGTVPMLPAGAMRQAVLSAQVAATAAGLALSDVRGTVDGGAVTGTMNLRAGKRPGIDASLSFQQLAVQAWVPAVLPFLPGGLPGGLPGSVPGGWTAVWSGLASWFAQLKQMDSDLHIQVAQASWGSTPLGPLELELQTDAARVVLRRLEVQPIGARLSASGQLGENGKLTDGRLELTAPDLAALRRLSTIPGLAAVQMLLRGPGSLQVQAAGPQDALVTRVVSEFSDLRIEAQPTVNLVSGRAAGALTVHHPGAPRLLETLGIGGTAAWLGDGSFSLVGQFATAPGRLELNGATLAAGAARATGQVTLTGNMLMGRVVAETLPLPAPYVRSPDPLPIRWLRNGQAALHVEAAQVLVGLEPVLQAASAELALQDGRLALSGVTGQAAGGTLTGSALLNAAAEPPVFTAQGQATGLIVPASLADMPIDLLAGKVDVVLSLSATGHSPAALLATLDGAGTIKLQNGLAQGFDLGAAAVAAALPDAKEAVSAARAALLGGTTPIATATAAVKVQRGIATVDGNLSSEAGAGTLSGTVDLRDGTQDLRLSLLPDGVDPPSLGLRVTGPGAAETRTPELAPFARWLSSRPIPAPSQQTR